MMPINIFVRYSNQNIQLAKVATLSQEGGLIYNDEGGDLKAHLKTSGKFAVLTAASPLISMARLVRSVAFGCSGKFHSGGHEFVGALGTPFVAGGCLVGSLLSSAAYVLSSGSVSFYVPMRRTYSTFEAWINQISLKDASSLPSYSHRVSNPMDCVSGRIWTTAPCMQPMLENGLSDRGGLLDRDRIQKMFPFVQVNDVHMERGELVIQSEYKNEHIHYTAYKGAYEHEKISTFCCCFRIESVYDRILCCEVGKGTCSLIGDFDDSCGIVSCAICGVGTCCCYQRENGTTTVLNTGCFGPEGFSCLTGLEIA